MSPGVGPALLRQSVPRSFLPKIIETLPSNLTPLLPSRAARRNTAHAERHGAVKVALARHIPSVPGFPPGFPLLLPRMLTKPRTVWACQPVAAMISANVAPLARFIKATTSAFLLARSSFGLPPAFLAGLAFFAGLFFFVDLDESEAAKSHL